MQGLGKPRTRGSGMCRRVAFAGRTREVDDGHRHALPEAVHLEYPVAQVVQLPRDRSVDEGLTACGTAHRGDLPDLPRPVPDQDLDALCMSGKVAGSATGAARTLRKICGFAGGVSDLSGLLVARVNRPVARQDEKKIPGGRGTWTGDRDRDTQTLAAGERGCRSRQQHPEAGLEIRPSSPRSCAPFAAPPRSWAGSRSGRRARSLR